MLLTVHQLKQVAAAGGGLTLDASAFTFNQLEEIVAAADAGGAQVSLRGVGGLTAAHLAELAALAPGRVSFDLSG
jgi:hypothetical protein